MIRTAHRLPHSMEYAAPAGVNLRQRTRPVAPRFDGCLRVAIPGRVDAIALAHDCRAETGLVWLHGQSHTGTPTGWSFLASRPFLVFRAWGSRCEVLHGGGVCRWFGNPWALLEELLGRYESGVDVDNPVPAGACFGYFGYGLGTFTEPRVRPRLEGGLGLPDCQVGFYGSLVAFDHEHDEAWIVATGLGVSGDRSLLKARRQVEHWEAHIQRSVHAPRPSRRTEDHDCSPDGADRSPGSRTLATSVTRDRFIAAVSRAQDYIRRGEIYQVNLSHRLTARWGREPWEFYERLRLVSPAPYAGFLNGGWFQLVSSSPELFLNLKGADIWTRPIKGTRPRARDATRDAQLAAELETNPKERAELVMITDLLRNDLGRVCEYGSVVAPELLRLESHAHVHHLVSTVQGRLRAGVSHMAALAACFPGGSVTGAPKVRAMEIIQELEPVARGPYTGAFGYVGFSRQSQLSIVIRCAMLERRRVHFPVGAGIVADSNPEAEYDETLAKAKGFFQVLDRLGAELLC